MNLCLLTVGEIIKCWIMRGIFLPNMTHTWAVWSGHMHLFFEGEYVLLYVFLAFSKGRLLL